MLKPANYDNYETINNLGITDLKSKIKDIQISALNRMEANADLEANIIEYIASSLGFGGKNPILEAIILPKLVSIDKEVCRLGLIKSSMFKEFKSNGKLIYLTLFGREEKELQSKRDLVFSIAKEYSDKVELMEMSE